MHRAVTTTESVQFGLPKEVDANVAMPMQSDLRIGSHLMKQKLRGNKKFPLIVELEPLFACNLKCAGCGKIQQPRRSLKQRMPVEQAVAAVEECGAPMVSIAGGEPLMHPQIEVIVQRADKTKEVRVPVHERACCCPSISTSSRRTATSLGDAHRRAARASRRGGVQRRRLRRGRHGDQVGPGNAASRSTTNTTFFNTDTPQTVIEVLDFLNDELQRRQHADLARLRVREGARPGALPGRAADPRAVPQGLRRTSGARSGG